MVTFLESLMFWRRQPTPQAPHQAEDKLIALKKLKESFDFDPFDYMYDRYYANGDWYLPVGSSVPGIGGTSNKVQGHDAYVFRTEQELRLQRDRARLIYATEPLAQAIVGHLRAFTVGCGSVYQVKEKKKFADKLNTDFLDAMQKEIDDWIDGEDWCAREQELFNCQVIDGEWFLRIIKQRGEITVRRIEPEHITNPPGGTVYNGWYLGVNCDPHDAETVLGYYYHAYPHNDGQPLDADEVIHFKDNVTRNVSRGVSSFFCLSDDIDSTGKLIDNCRDGAAARARIAYIRSHKNAVPSAVNSFAAAQASASGTTASGRSWRGKSSRGSVEVDAGENMEISTMPSGDSEGYISAVGLMMRVLGNRWGMPEFMVSADASNNNYASILVSGGPFVRQIEMAQAKLKREYKKLMEMVLKNGARKGLYPVEMLEQVEIDVQAPSPVIQDKLVEAQTYDIEARNKVISPQGWAAKLGRDPEKIQQDWDAFNDANMEAGLIGQGINPQEFGKSEDKPAKESISENTLDASGHMHLGKGSPQGGQFTGKGVSPEEYRKRLHGKLDAHLKTGGKLPVASMLTPYNVSGEGAVRLSGGHIEVIDRGRKGNYVRVDDTQLGAMASVVGEENPFDNWMKWQSTDEGKKHYADMQAKRDAEDKLRQDKLDAEDEKLSKPKHELTPEEYDELYPRETKHFDERGVAEFTKAKALSIVKEMPDDVDWELMPIGKGKYSIYHRPSHDSIVKAATGGK